MSEQQQKSKYLNIIYYKKSIWYEYLPVWREKYLQKNMSGRKRSVTVLEHVDDHFRRTFETDRNNKSITALENFIQSDFTFFN